MFFFYTLQLSVLKTGGDFGMFLIPASNESQLISNFKSLEYLDVSNRKTDDECMHMLASHCNKLRYTLL